MAIEIERKFLVASDAWRAQAAGEGERYLQGYLAIGERSVVRVRIAGERRAWIGVKEHRIGRARGEYEYPIPVADARELLQLVIGRLVEKNRYRVPHAGQVWELDEFLGANAGLVVAEIELAAAEEEFERPSWLGAEVTAERAYYNAALALHPWTEWENAELRRNESE
ncbi:MAG TPA: CYTH domain-containing protein [Gammaproteobacteria bacterium]|nr:CYTH domain-containing protein [Gammaproteobacteria bacterium]